MSNKPIKIDEATLEAVRKLVDTQCSDLQYWFSQAVQVGDHQMARVYQNAQNELWTLRQKMTATNLEKNYSTYEKYPKANQML
jgi:hypothetical protein